MKSLLVILTGGQATRMKIHGKCLAKCILPVGNTTLLRRQLYQARQAGIDEIIVSTNKLFYDQVKESVSHLNKIKVVLNPFHKDGSMAALLHIIKSCSAEHKIFMSFGDIYFMDNPFINIKEKTDVNGVFLAISKPFNRLELSRGGIVFVKSGIVSRIVEKPLARNQQGYRWTGIAALDHFGCLELKRYLEVNKNFPEENFFESLRKLISIKVVVTNDFLNVNNLSQLFIATLYQVAESIKNKKLSRDLIILSNSIRKKLLKDHSILSDQN